MSTVTISTPSVESLIVALRIIKAHVDYRKSVGFELYQRDEEYEYNTQPEHKKVCPVCQEFSQIPIYYGSDIKAFFPSHKWLTPGVQPYRLYRNQTYLIYPDVHKDHIESHGDCHCTLVWLHPTQTLATRLTNELNEAILPYV